MTDRRSALFLSLWLLAPAGAFGQHTEADDVEVIKPPKVGPSPTEKKPDLARVAKQIVQKTNDFRKEQGRVRMEVNAKLTKAAEDFARYMAKTDRYGHTADGDRPADRAKNHGYEYCIVLENIAYQYNSAGFASDDLAKKFFEGWEGSPGHRRNMLDADVTETGVAVARSDKTGYYYAVQMFGRPKSKAIQFEIVNQSAAAVNYRLGEQTFALPPNYTRTHTRCRPPEVNFRPASGRGDGQTVRPESGDRLVLTDGKDGYQVKKEDRPAQTKKP